MPIIGLTDTAARFPQIGILRKGAPKGERGPGKDLDHFRFDTEHADALAMFRETYGDTPRAINIYLPYATTDENFVAWQEHWVGGGLVHRCDGQTCVMRRRPDGRYDHTPVPCPSIGLPETSKDRCKPVGRLQVIIPELKRLAYVTVLTSSIHDIKNLSAQLAALELMNGGSLRGIPMTLRRSAVEISMPGEGGKRVRREKWLLSIEAAPRWVSMQLAAMEHAAPALPSAPDRLALPPAPMTDEDGVVVEMVDDTAPRPIASVDVQFNKQGFRYVTFTLEGDGEAAPYLMRDAGVEFEHLEVGDRVIVTAHLETIKGKNFQVVDSIDGERNADGMTDWEERAAAAAIDVEPAV